jgi:putative phage-type endonuclease
VTDTTLTPEDERTEWLAWRKGGIGASDISALLGMSNFASPMSVYLDKLGLSGPDDDNEYMEFGRRAEPMLVGYFEDRHPGLFVIDCQARVESEANPVHRCTLDGRVVEHPDGEPIGVAEWKTGGFDVWETIPDAYACQVQWQMHVDQRDHAWFGVLHGRKFRTYEVERDQRAIDFLVEAADEFWTNHVLAEKPPPADGHRATTEALGLAFPDPVEGEAVDLDEVQWALNLREEAKATMANAKVEIARSENAIKAAIGDAEIGHIKGEPIITWKKVSRNGYEVKPTTYRQLASIRAKK